MQGACGVMKGGSVWGSLVGGSWMESARIDTEVLANTPQVYQARQLDANFRGLYLTKNTGGGG